MIAGILASFVRISDVSSFLLPSGEFQNKLGHLPPSSSSKNLIILFSYYIREIPLWFALISWLLKWPNRDVMGEMRNWNLPLRSIYAMHNFTVGKPLLKRKYSEILHVLFLISKHLRWPTRHLWKDGRKNSSTARWRKRRSLPTVLLPRSYVSLTVLSASYSEGPRNRKQTEWF